MQAWSGTRRRAWVIATVVGVWGIAELIAGFGAIPALGAELSPAQIVALRFPTAWHAPAHSPSPTTPVAARGAAWQLASSEIFNPYPTYATRSGEPALADAGLSQAAMAYADPATELVAESHHGRSSGYQLASATPAPERRAEPHRVANPRPNVLNDAQIASIRERLNLTPGQERMWPAVGAALRDLVYKKPPAGGQKTAQGGGAQANAARLDPNSPEVARLKTAAVPLVMSFDSEQKRELRTLAHLIGLGSLAAQF